MVGYSTQINQKKIPPFSFYGTHALFKFNSCRSDKLKSTPKTPELPKKNQNFIL
jgi:hypothetical protein